MKKIKQTTVVEPTRHYEQKVDPVAAHKMFHLRMGMKHEVISRSKIESYLKK